MRLAWGSAPQASTENKQASQQTNTRRCLLKLFLHNCDWPGAPFHQQANKTSKQANNETNEHSKNSLLKLFLHNCDWPGAQLHKQAQKTSKRANKQTSVDVLSNFFFIIATGLGLRSTSKQTQEASKEKGTNKHTWIKQACIHMYSNAYTNLPISIEP